MAEGEPNEQVFLRTDLGRTYSARTFYVRMPEKMRNMLHDLTKQGGEIEAVRLTRRGDGEYDWEIGFIISADLGAYEREGQWLDNLTSQI